MDGWVRSVFSDPMEFREVKDEPRQQPVTPKKRRKPKPPQANGGSSSSAVASSSLSRTPSSSPTSDDGDGKGGGQQQQDHEQGGGGRKPRLVWTTELHKLFVEAYDSLGDDAVPRKILEKMNEKINIPEVSREQIASHLQKHKINMRREAKVPPSHSPTEEAPASHSLRSLPPNTTMAEEVSHQAQLELVQVLQEQPDCLSRRSNSSSITTNLHIAQSIQQLFGPPIKEGEAQPGETMQRALAHSGCSPVEGHGWNLENKGCTGQHMETSIAAILVPEANTEAILIRMAEAANAENAAPAPAAGSIDIIAQFWSASPGNEASSTSSRDIFGPSARARGT